MKWLIFGLAILAAAANETAFSAGGSEDFPSFRWNSLPDTIGERNTSVALGHHQTTPEFLISTLPEQPKQLTQLNEKRSLLPPTTRKVNCDADAAPALFASFEVPFLKPFLSGASSVAATGLTTGRLVSPAVHPSVRFLVGGERENGLGLRASYWLYDDTSLYAAPYSPSQLGIEAQTVDVEIYTRHEYEIGDLWIGGGVRYGSLRYSNVGGDTPFNPGRVDFEGVGPVLALAAKRDIGGSSYLLARTKAAVLYGDLTSNSLLVNMPAGTIQDEVMYCFECQLGYGFTAEISNDLIFAFEATLESQVLANNSLQNDYFGIGSNLGMFGPALKLELLY